MIIGVNIVYCMGVKCSIDEKFFSTWNPDMAYILGFFCADGSLIDDRISRGKYIRFTNTDLDIIEQIRTTLFSSHKILATPAKGHQKAKYVLSIGRDNMFKDLIKLGISTNKSLTIKTPDVPSEYSNDFVRGYLDGDGCIHIEKRGILRIVFTCGSRPFLAGLDRMISSACKTQNKKIYSSRRCFQLRYSQKEALVILSWLYNKAQSSLYLERKKDIYRNFLAKLN
jgi:hypothetical protein